MGVRQNRSTSNVLMRAFTPSFSKRRIPTNGSVFTTRTFTPRSTATESLNKTRQKPKHLHKNSNGFAKSRHQIWRNRFILRNNLFDCDKNFIIPKRNRSPKMKSAVKTFLLFTILCFCPLFAAAQDFLPELVKRIKPSAVAIETFDAKGNTVSRGSGFFVASDKIITNRHVIEKSSRAEIHLANGKKFPVKGVLAIDGEGDLALLQVEVPPATAVPLQIMQRVPQEGESIVVIGNPFGLEGSVSNGIVSAVREISGYGKIIQITAPISPGSSGSPVVNMYGQVIGIATLQAAEGQSLNFAVPSDRILQLKVTELQTVSSLTADTQKNKRSAAERSYSQGVAQLSRDDYGRALQFFERATELDSNYAEAWYQAGFCYGILGRHQDALKASRQAARLRPEWAEAHVNIGASSYALGQYKEAAD